MSATIFNTASHKMSNGFVYKWTYIPTGEYYIGIHKGTTNDGYTGSGTRFTKKFRNTTRKNWKREILFEGDYWNECTAVERDLVNKDTLTDPLCLNVAQGGRRGPGGLPNDKKKKSYRCKPQEIVLNGITYPTRMNACKTLNISFEKLDQLLIETGDILYCKYNHYNKY